MKATIKRRTSGFTLVELMLVIAIMAIMMSISVAAFNSIYQMRGIEGARNIIKSALNTARMRAMRDRRDVTALLSIDGARDVGFIVESDYGNDQIYVINRLPLEDERRLTHHNISLFENRGIQKHWAPALYQSRTPQGHWVFFVSGEYAERSPVRIHNSGRWFLSTFSALTPFPESGTVIAIVRGPFDVPPAVHQYKISSDARADSWDSLPRFIEVDGRYFPITFQPDGTASLRYDNARIRLRDIRSNDDKWAWRLVMDRATSRVSESRIAPSDPDAEYKR